MEPQNQTELERILQITVEDLGEKIKELSIDLNLARAQIKVMKQAEQQAKEKAEKEGE